MTTVRHLSLAVVVETQGPSADEIRARLAASGFEIRGIDVAIEGARRTSTLSVGTLIRPMSRFLW
jgi:hypothetical protein